MQDSEFSFSSDEIKLVSDTDFFKQKSIITKKIISLLHELNNSIEQIKKENIYQPEEINKISGKISKGENYLGLPYVVLDNPRIFSSKNIFAFRSMFWWGNYFSFTLHLSGKSLEDAEKNIYKNFELLKGKDFLICIHSEQWVHHLEKDNYESIDLFNKTKIKRLVEQKGFLKLSRKLALKKWNEVEGFGTETLKNYFSVIQS